jgi:hypothetical protein
LKKNAVSGKNCLFTGYNIDIRQGIKNALAKSKHDRRADVQLKVLKNSWTYLAEILKNNKITIVIIFYNTHMRFITIRRYYP